MPRDGSYYEEMRACELCNELVHVSCMDEHYAKHAREMLGRGFCRQVVNEFRMSQLDKAVADRDKYEARRALSSAGGQSAASSSGALPSSLAASSSSGAATASSESPEDPLTAFFLSRPSYDLQEGRPAAIRGACRGGHVRRLLRMSA